jgi:hypothetical protein
LLQHVLGRERDLDQAVLGAFPLLQISTLLPMPSTNPLYPVAVAVFGIGMRRATT